MFKSNKKLKIIILVILSVSLVGGAVLSYFVFFRKPDEVPVPTNISCSVALKDNEYIITNTGNKEAYVRVAVVSNWVSESTDENGNSIIYWQTPEYTVTLKSTETVKWQEYGGFYYCLSTIQPQDVNDQDEESVAFATIEITGTAPEDYVGKVSVVAEAIETSILADSWKVNISPEGVTAVA